MVRPRALSLVALVVLALAALPAACSSTTPTSPPVTVVPGSWERRADAPTALTEVAVAALDGRIWIAGGLTGDGTGSTGVLVYDPATDSWTEGPALPEPVHHAALVGDGETLYVVGGYAGSGFDSPTDAVRRLDDARGAWVDAAPLPEPRAAGAAAWDGSRVVYAGGVEPGAVSGAVFALELEGWSQIARLANPREHLAAASDGAGGTFVLGGRVGGLDANRATVDLVDGRSASTIGELPTKRGGVAAFWWPSLGACLVGGESPGGTNAQVECIDRNGSVSMVPGLNHPRHGLGAAVVDRVAYVLLGGEQPGLFVSPVVEAFALP